MRSLPSTYLESAAKRAVVEVITFGAMREPRLRFDRTALGLVKRLRWSIASRVPEGKTLIVTITAPIRQDSKTGLVLRDRIRELLATRQTRLKATIHGNRVEVHVLKGGSTRTARLIGFVHNPEPNPVALFQVTRSLLACINSKKRSPGGDRWLMVDNRAGLAPVRTLRQVCVALRARTVFKRILLADKQGTRLL